MWIGRGFDTDGDGDNDVFVGQKLTKEQSAAAGCGALIGLALAAIAIPIAIAAESENMGFWAWISKHFPWGPIGWLVGFIVVVAILSVFMKPGPALATAFLLCGGWFGITCLSSYLGVPTWAVTLTIGAAAGISVVVLAVRNDTSGNTQNVPKNKATPSAKVERAKRQAAENNKWVESCKALTSLSPQTAASLAKLNGRSLYLEALTTLSEAAASELSGHKGDLYLNGLKSLSNDTAAALARREGVLCLNGLTTLSPWLAKALAKHKGNVLSLMGVTQLSPEAAESLSHYKGDSLYLDGLITLSDEAAKALRSNTNIVLPDKFKR